MSNITAALVKELRDRTGAGMMECKKALTESNGDIELAIDNMRKSGQAKAAKKSGRTAAEGVVLSRVSADSKTGYIVELNCETDFVAKDASFLALANKVADYVVANGVADLEAVKAQFEEERAQLVAKIGENMAIRRVASIAGDFVGGYNHGTKISVLVATTKADEEVAKKLGMHIASSGTEYVNPSDVPAEVVARERKVLVEIEDQKPESQRKPAELQEKILEGQLRKFVDQKCLVTQEFVMDPSKKVGDFLKSEGLEVTGFLCLKAGEGIEKEEEDFAAEVAKITGSF